jgi:hypothetical protein
MTLTLGRGEGRSEQENHRVALQKDFRARDRVGVSFLLLLLPPPFFLPEQLRANGTTRSASLVSAFHCLGSNRKGTPARAQKLALQTVLVWSLGSVHGCSHRGYSCRWPL